MIKALTTAILLGHTQAGYGGDFTDEEVQGLDLSRGFFKGSGTVTADPTYDDSMKSCLMYLDHIYGYADKAYPLIKKDNMRDKLSGIDKISHMISMIKSSESRCGALNADWDKIKLLANQWKNPNNVQFRDGILFVHGVDIDVELKDSITAWDAKDYERVGEEIGFASLVLIGEVAGQGQGQGPHQAQGQGGQDQGQGQGQGSDPVSDYFYHLGSQFASGFLYGVYIGAFDEDDIYECLKTEPKTMGVFQNADTELKKSLTNLGGTANDGIDGFIDMIRFIIQLTQESKDVATCAVLTQYTDQSDMDNAMNIIAELKDENNTMKYNEDGDKFMFNGNDISDEFYMWTDAYINGNFRAMGYIFADTLYKNSFVANGGTTRTGEVIPVMTPPQM